MSVAKVDRVERVVGVARFTREEKVPKVSRVKSGQRDKGCPDGHSDEESQGGERG